MGYEMTLAQDWEQPLLRMAVEAVGADSVRPEALEADHALLRRAYAHADAVTAAHSRSFTIASRMLPAPKREGIRALYAFCRTTDDLVDRPMSDPVRALARWRAYTPSDSATHENLVSIAWADTCRRFSVPPRLAQQLIDGVTQDLNPQRYRDFDSLAHYCYGVASTVGLMSMHIIGYDSDEAVPYAIKLGVALQLTNILRDVGEDYRIGRLYLPQDELAEFGVDEDFFARPGVTQPWRALMRFQIARARRLYAEAWPGIRLLSPDGQFAIQAAAGLYRGILDEIERNDFDVFTRRAYVPAARRARVLAALWLSSRTTGRAS
jgi:phytoene synthase